MNVFMLSVSVVTRFGFADIGSTVAANVVCDGYRLQCFGRRSCFVSCLFRYFSLWFFAVYLPRCVETERDAGRCFHFIYRIVQFARSVTDTCIHGVERRRVPVSGAFFCRTTVRLPLIVV